MEAEVRQLTPSLSLPSMTAPGLTQVCGQLFPGSSRLPLTAPGLPTCLPQKAALKNHGERAQSPTHPLARPRVFGGRTCRKDPRSN